MKTIKVKNYLQIPKDFTGVAEYADGSKAWYLNGECHRENDLPAVEFANGVKEWWLNGKCHRENDLPAIESSTGSKYWILNGKLHRENDLPAVEHAEGIKQWFLNGLFHRENGPAIEWDNGYKAWYLNDKKYSEEEWKKEVEKLKMDKTIKIESFSQIPKDFTGIAEFPDGSKQWFLNGKIHRENGLPAIEWSDGSKAWYLNGLVHRETGPAVEYANGTKFWILNGKRHRENGPACEHADGTKEWWLNDKKYSEEDWKKEVEKLKMNTKTIKVKSKSEIPNDFTGITEFVDGKKQWFSNGKLHRENDLPAIEHPNGTKMWYLNGKLHRENDLPAIENASGSKWWYLNGKLHRENDLPACKYPNGAKEWYLNGKLHRENGPAIDYASGTKRWYLNGELHRENDLPACEYPDGAKEWYLNGVLHRENGHAVEFVDGRKQWWLNGQEYLETDWKKEVEKIKKQLISGVCISIPNKLVINKTEILQVVNNDEIKQKTKEIVKQTSETDIDFVDEAKKAQYRVLRNKIMKLLEGKITEFADNIGSNFKTKKQKTEFKEKVANAVKTEIGQTLLKFAIGGGLQLINSKMPDKLQPHIENIATEFRVDSISNLEVIAIEALVPIFDNILNVITNQIVGPKEAEIIKNPTARIDFSTGNVEVEPTDNISDTNNTNSQENTKIRINVSQTAQNNNIEDQENPASTNEIFNYNI